MKSIYNHTARWQVSATAEVALFCLLPEGAKNHENNLLNKLMTASATVPKFFELSEPLHDTWEVSWRIPEGKLLDAIRSIPRHLKKTKTSLAVHVILFSHGVNGYLCFGPDISAETVLDELISLKLPQLQTVSLLACQSLKAVRLPRRLPFNLIGFREDVYTNELLFFTARFLYWYSICKDFEESLQHARKYSAITLKSIVYRNKNQC